METFYANIRQMFRFLKGKIEFHFLVKIEWQRPDLLTHQNNLKKWEKYVKTGA